jgi:hypothetical protein
MSHNPMGLHGRYRDSFIFYFYLYEDICGVGFIATRVITSALDKFE